MKKHVEMIIDYIVVGEDYQYFDNHGIITRCQDCMHWVPSQRNKCFGSCDMDALMRPMDYFCANGRRREHE